MRAYAALALVVAFAGAGLASCGQCGCQDQLNRCLKQAGPGASTSDCYAAHDDCVRMCSAQRADDSDAGRTAR